MNRVMPVLTLQQLRVVLQLAEGRDYKQAAHNLELSVHTVRLHVIRIAMRLDGLGSPKGKILRNADRLICAQPVEMVIRAQAA
jgi:hypothetical protein